MNPIELADKIKERYLRYLQTTFYFRDPILRESFERALASGQLSKGPYLEATKVFSKGATTGELFQGLLGKELEDSFLDAMYRDRPLYLHQDQAIRASHDKQNVVVATGTGSGKTEAFIYPVLLHLYQQHKQNELGPGVRALILYPMNALANDQRERLGQICERLKDNKSDFSFTFGQYIGETPEDENDRYRNARLHLENRKPGELVLRSEIRKQPPHILLTNYSMLEYLLLRPQDTPLFDGDNSKTWTFLILDEAHQYQGSRGTEMAMLLRRLKQRLRQEGCKNDLRCIATSATLGKGKYDSPAIASFATDLFGEDFHNENVILVEETPFESGPEEKTLSSEDYEYLWNLIYSKDQQSRSNLDSIANRLGIASHRNLSIELTIGMILKEDSRITRLRHMITGKAIDVQTIANDIFCDINPEQERMSHLTKIIDVLQKAIDPDNSSTLLSTRYHYFLRSLEGAYLSYLPKKQIFLERKNETDKGVAFEVALCRECGQHYIVGRILGNRLVEAIRDPGSYEFQATYFKPIEDRVDKQDQENGGSPIEFILCTTCGEISKSDRPLECDHNTSILVELHEGAEEREGQIPECPVCGYKAPDPVREIVHGTDGPHAVIATTLYQYLPETRKKVLAFADGRQEAAFFAWYLEKSYYDLLNRNLINKTIKTIGSYAPEGLSLSELSIGLRDHFKKSGASEPSIGDLDLLRKAWLCAYREFLQDQPRISLEGVGLAHFEIKWPDWFAVPVFLRESPWSLSDEEASNLIMFLLETLRTDGAVEIHSAPGVSIQWSDLEIQTSQMCVVIGPPRQKKNQSRKVKSWDGVNGKRVHFLTKLLRNINKDIDESKAKEEAVRALRFIWESLRECDNQARTTEEKVIIPIDDGGRLNPDWWRIRQISQDNIVHRCDICGRIQPFSIRNLCLRHRCPGTTSQVTIDNLEPNHYRDLYESDLPASLRVEEHTAQLDKEKAREYQNDFRRGKISVLSCSTTFELGVDLGDLDTIFLRNVPPESFNYKQRVGRAGRREMPGFAITFCRRGPHDLFHFAEPDRMINGKIRPPILTLFNDQIILRHITAIMLSSFFHHNPNLFGKVKDLFQNLNAPSGVDTFRNFLRKYEKELTQQLKEITPIQTRSKIGLNDSTWIENIAGTESRFYLAEAEVATDYKTAKKIEDEAIAIEPPDYDKAKWARDRANTIAEEELLSFLSRKVVIPKYGFPVDVVELDTQRTQQNAEAKQVLLQRDLGLAISEFAPTSKLVVNKKEWSSYGLKKVIGKEWPKKHYKVCAKHNVFVRWSEGEKELPMPCQDQDCIPHTYIEPRFGFITGTEKPKKPTHRPIRAFSTRPYFAGLAESGADEIHIPDNKPVVTLTKSSPGNLVVLCEGRRGEGFYICSSCGAGFRGKSRKATHQSPYGQQCNGTLQQVSLGHEFITNVVQIQFLNTSFYGMDPIWFTYSLAYALVDGTAEALGIPATDLNATISYSSGSTLPPIVLYDAVPGGAALVDQLEDKTVLRSALENALDRVSGKCGCGEDTSCYGCLRNYRNQFAHHNLRRGPVKQHIQSVLSLFQ